MPDVDVSLSISSHEYLAYYAGIADTVLAKSRDGRRIRFPARVLRPFLTHQGIHGNFRIQFDDRNKFVAIDQLPEELGAC